MRDKIYNFFKYSGEFALYGLLFFLPISNALIETFFGIALFSFIVRKTIKPDFSSFKFWPNFILLFFFIFIGLSLLNSGEYFQKSLWAWLAKWGQYLGICFIVQDTVCDKKVLKRALMVFLFSATLVVLSGATQYFFGVEFLRGKKLMCIPGRFCAVTSSFSHYNSLGAYLSVVIPVFLLLFISKLKRSERLAYPVFFILFLSLFIDMLVFSRGSWLGLILSILFLGMLLKEKFERWIVFLILLIFFLFFLTVSYSHILSFITKNVFISPFERSVSIFQPGGDADRFRYWQIALRMIWENPIFGKGVGTFMDYFSKYLPGVNVSYAHNCYLQIFAETGVFSIFSFLLYVFSMIYVSVKSLMKQKDYLLLGLFGGCFGYLIHAFFDTLLYSLPLAFLFWMWMGLLTVSIRLNNTCREAK